MHRLQSNPRSGKVLVLVSLLLPALCGMIALVLDAGALFAGRRQGQNAADAASRVVAMKLLAGESSATALAAAEEIVRTQHRLTGATVVVNSPPSLGVNVGDTRYSEVIVTVPVNTWFIQVLSGPTNPQAVSRAVAGSELGAPKELISALDPSAGPGLTVDGVTLTVGGRVWVNSQGTGVDEAGATVNLGVLGPAARVLNGGTVRADRLRVVGGVDTPASYRTAAGAACLKASELLMSDPFLNLATPTTANGVLAVYPGADGQNHDAPQDVSILLTSGESVSLSPGIYGSIEVTGGPGTVTFQAGIYVLRGGHAGHALNLSTTGTIVGTGVMFYNTGSNYAATTGGPDKSDGNQLGTDMSVTFGDINIDAGNLNLTSLTGSESPFAGYLIYQRRWNTKPIVLKRNASGDTISGTAYARWAQLTAVGPGIFQSQFVVGKFVATGASGSVGLVVPTLAGKAQVVYLVE
ncbi:MAG: hypothetical protein K8U57_36630 [Planctomycetes bacterium]|nr:hypothetical protein [Planctomycetota bacterium]